LSFFVPGMQVFLMTSPNGAGLCIQLAYLEDTIIKRRLGQKMTFLFEDVTDQAAVTDEQLHRHLEENAGSYRVDPEFSFSHVYLNSDKRGDAVEKDARRLLDELRKSPAAEGDVAAGDPFLLPHRYESLPRWEAARIFGADFAEGLVDIDPGRWEGPVRSGFGLHLVLMRERTEGRLPELEEVRDQVLRDVVAKLHRENSRKFYERLRERYTITVERPGTAGAQADGEAAR
jgi:hypothetical protein